MYNDEEEIGEDEFKMNTEDDLDLPPPEGMGMEDDFGLDDPEEKYH